MTDLFRLLREAFDAHDPFSVLHAIRQALAALSPLSHEPVDFVQWVPVEQVQANDYNPNSVARAEMQLLYTSILHDGFTQPVVTVYDAEQGKYIIVDGFHRFFVMTSHQDIYDRCQGRLPVVVLDKETNDRMASTIRHNRARGKHSVQGMSAMIFTLLDNGWTDAEICNELGMEAEELVRLKHLTGFSKLFEDIEYHKAWMTRRQVMLKHRSQDV